MMQATTPDTERAESSAPSWQPRYSRRIKLPKPTLQLRLIGGFLGIALVALITQAIYLGWLLVRLSHDLPLGGDELANSSADLVVHALLFSAVVLLPLTVLIGAQLTFKTAGPLYRFEQYLAEVAAGGRPRPCKIRDGDELQDLCDLINDALAEARRQGREDAAAGDAPRRLAG